MDKRGSREGRIRKETLWSRSVARIFCGEAAIEAKVDKTTEMHFLLSDPFI